MRVRFDEDAATAPRPLARSRLGVRAGVLVMFGVAVALIVLLAVGVFTTTRRYREEQAWLLRAYQTREQILGLAAAVQEAEIDARGYGIAGGGRDLAAYWRTSSRVDRDLAALSDLTATEPAQMDDVRRLRAAVAEQRKRYEHILADYRAQGPDAARAAIVALASDRTRPVQAITAAMLDREAQQVARRTATGMHHGRLVATATAFALGASLLLLLAALVSVAREQRRGARSEAALAENSRRLEFALAAAERAGIALKRLSALAELLQNCRTIEEAVAVMERSLPPLLAGNSGVLALINPSRTTAEARLHWGTLGPALAAAVFAPDDCWALRRSQPHPQADEPAAPLCAHLAHARLDGDFSLCLPLSSQGQVLGVLTLRGREPFTLEPRQLAMATADQLAIAIANLRLQASLRTESIHDPLTGLFNRRYLEASLPREMVRTERRKGALSVLMFDLDHFKQYNDTEGHAGGDALLSAFGALLTQSCRGGDIPCRFGGEEFTVVLTDTDHAQALARAETIRKATSELVIHFRGGVLPRVTTSIGVSSYPGHGDDVDTLMRAADQALYRAKQLGRNAVASANELAPEPGHPASGAGA